MKKKTAVVLSSCAAIAVCSSLIVGSTYALFTSEDKVNIAVTAGKVSVKAEVLDETLALTSMGEAQVGNVWENGGSAGFTDKSTLKLNEITPGDGVTFNIKVTNDSTVNVKYRLNWSVSGELANVLEAEATGAKFDEWTEWTVPATENEKVKTLSVSVTLPSYVGDIYQGKTADVNFSVEAVQGNAAVSDNANVSVWDGETADTSWCVFPENQVDLTEEQRTFTLTTAAQLAGFAKIVNEGETFYHTSVQTSGAYKEARYIVKLGADINLDNKLWTPIGKFCGTFDGDNHTISNLKVIGGNGAGLFGNTGNGSMAVKNTRIVNAYVSGTNYVGALVGAAYTSELSNNYVENATVICVPYEKGERYDGGAKAGVLGGFIKNASATPTEVYGNVIKNCEVYAYRDLGGLIGCAQNENNAAMYTIHDNTVVSVTVNYLDKDNYQPYDGGNVNENIGKIAGRIVGKNNDLSWVVVQDNNAVSNVNISGVARYASSQEDFVVAFAGLKVGESFTLVLAEGTYSATAARQLLVTGNNVTIKGAGADKTVIDCGAYQVDGQAGLFISGNNATVSNLTVKTSSADGNVAAVKVSDSNNSTGIIENIVIENVVLESVNGHGLNLHGVKGVTVDNVNVKSYGKSGISLALATDVVITNSTTVSGGWKMDVQIQYADNGNYETASSLTIGEGNVFGNGVIRSDRPATATEGLDKVTYNESEWTKSDLSSYNLGWLLSKN